MSWFKFNGKHCEDDMKVRYAPTAAERGGYFAKLSIDGDEYTSRSGGSYRGTRKKPLEFTLPCFYEEISRAEKEKILRWLAPGKRGQLVLDDRPYCYYDVVIGAEMSIDEYPVVTVNGTRYSGIFKLSMIAHDPHAKLFEKTIEFGDTSGAYDETGLIPEEMMPAAPTTDGSWFLAYNPGTERCGLTVRIAGDTGEDGSVVLYNEATGQTCTVKYLTKELTTDAGMWVEIDGAQMETRWQGAATSEIDYRHHDDGYLALVSGMPAVKDIVVSYVQGGGAVSSPDGRFDDEMTGQYIFLNGDWRLITLVRNPFEMEVAWTADATANENTVVATMNRITVTKTGGATLSKLEIDYQPKVR